MPGRRKVGRRRTRLSGQKVLNLILKTDVFGSIEAIEGVLKEIPRAAGKASGDAQQEKTVLRILKSEVGEINESDIKFAKAYPVKGYPALILGFRVRPNPVAKSLAERERIKILNFEVIYDLVEGVRKFMEKISEPETVRIDLGKIKVSTVFLTEKNRQIVGGKIIEGEVKKGVSIEILRNEEIIGKGRLINLQRNKKDIEKVGKGEECGILYEGEVKISEGDILIIYTEDKRKIEI